MPPNFHENPYKSTFSFLKNLEVLKTCMFHYRKEDLITRGCKLRSFRISTLISIKTIRKLFLCLKHPCTVLYCTENMGSKHPCTENIGSRHVMIKMENYWISCNYCSKVKNQNKNIKMSCVYKQGETIKSFLGKIINVFVVAYITSP